MNTWQDSRNAAKCQNNPGSCARTKFISSEGIYMKLSARIQSLTSSPIRKLSPYADAAKAKGKKIYHLNIGQPDIKTPDQFMESIRTYDEQVIAYGNSKGEGFLIEAIRKYYAEKGMDFAADDIFITNGGSEA